MINRYWVAAALALAVALVVRIKMGAKEKGDAVLKGVPRLPTEVIPRSYDVELKPNLETCHFEGKLVVKVDIIEPTSEIILNAADLKIAEKSAWVRLDDSREVLWPSVHLDAENELLILKLEQSLKAGSASLSLEFEGVLNDQMKGFYRSSYQVGEEKRNMAVTQFEPADARRCFPCWDEPARKAKFKITVHAPVDRVVLSNMPVQMENVSNGIKTIQFEETPIMSTYLVAIVVGELGYVEGTTVDGSKVRVYCDPGKVDQGKFALDVALRTLPYYAEYFGTAYPLPKLDMVAIPDFAAGAMENYGLVTYREAALLFDEKNSAAANRQRIAIVVAHELAHQWFGNLVTMEWWTHLWLNEGFATWVSYLAIDHLFPEWNVWTQFNELTAEAFRLDGLVESHPIEVDIGHVREIDEIFDAISYKKGASIIRMLENYLTPKVFQKGLASYIKKYAYKNAKTENLWDVLSHESGQPIRELMDSWTKQQGYPVVYVQFKENALDIVQSQYLSNGSPGTGEWVVPVTFCCGNYASPASTLVQEKFGSFVVSSNLIDENVEQWVKINVGQTGFYRVHYDEHLFSKLKSAIAAGSLQAADRLGILDDTYALCKACKLPVKDLLSLMEVYKQETEYAVLSCLISVAHAVAKVICDAFPDLGDAADAFVSSIFQDAAKRVGWEPQQSESHLISMLRGELISALVTFGDHETVNESRRRFNLYLNDRDTPYLPPDIRKAAYEAVMQGVTKQDRSGYEALLQLYRETDLSQERTRILSALAASRDPRVVREALEFSLSSEVRNQDAIYILSGVGKEGRETTWSWFKENWDQIWNRWGEGFLITRFISGSASGFYTDEKADEIASFFSTRSNKAIERTVSQTVERVRINSQWVKHVRDEHGLLEMLKS